MTRKGLVWAAVVPAWAAAALGVLNLGSLSVGTNGCPLDGPWG
jgi:hypothetical protein